MQVLTMTEINEVNGGSWEMDAAGAWVGTVAGVGLGLVGAPVLIGAAIGLGLAGAFIGASYLLEH